MRKRIIAWIAVLLFMVGSVANAQEFLSDPIVTGVDAVWVDLRTYADLGTAITDIGAADATLMIAEPTVSGAVTIPANVKLKFSGDGMITTGGTIAVNTRWVEAGFAQIFAVTGAGEFDFVNGSVVKASWFVDVGTAIAQTNNDAIRLRITEPSSILVNVTVGNFVTLEFGGPGCEMSVAGGVNVANIGDVLAGDFRIFIGAGDFDFVAGTQLKSVWFRRLRSIPVYVGTDVVEVAVVLSETIDADVAFAATTSITIPRGNVITIPGGRTLTINGSVFAGPYQVFVVTGTLTMTEYSGLVYNEWTGGTGGVSLRDGDGDTMIQVEESADEDKIRFDTAGAQRAQIDVDGLSLQTGASVNEFSTDGTLAGNSNDAVPTEQAVKTYADTKLGNVDVPGFLIRAEFESVNDDTIRIDSAVYHHEGTVEQLVYWNSQLTKQIIGAGADTWYFLYLDDSAIVTLGSNLLTNAELLWSAVVPGWSQNNHGYYNGDDRAIFAVLTDVAGDFYEFFHDGGRFVVHSDQKISRVQAALSSAWVDVTLHIPPVAKGAEVTFQDWKVDADTQLLWRTNGQVGTDGHIVVTTNADKGRGENTFRVMTDDSEKIEVRHLLATTNQMSVSTDGWYLPRGM